MRYTPSEQAVLREFGLRVRRARNLRGWSQIELAEHAGLNRAYVGGIERGQRNLGLLNVNKLALALDEDFAGYLPCRPRRPRR